MADVPVTVIGGGVVGLAISGVWRGPVKDFIVHEEGDRGLPGLINLIGIDSPGLTASLALARMVGLMVS